MAKKTAKKTTTRTPRQDETGANDLTVASAAPEPVANPNVLPHDVATRAYHIFLSRGATPGRELDDWLQAERELQGNHDDECARRFGS